PEPVKYALILATEGEKPEYDGFRLFRWQELCQHLRAHLPDIAETTGLVIAALACGFVGAVEERLLGFNARMARGIIEETLATFDTRVIDYLEESLKEKER